jgi:hypothetical protein
MGADQALKSTLAVPAEPQTRENAQYEPFGLLGRKVSKKDRIKKGIFFFSAAAAAGYYLFLLVLFLLR